MEKHCGKVTAYVKQMPLIGYLKVNTQNTLSNQHTKKKDQLVFLSLKNHS
jgi:hypothetical protein